MLMFAVLVHFAAWHVSDFSAQGLACLAWALAVATLGQLDVPLFAALATVTSQHVNDLKPQGLSNAA